MGRNHIAHRIAKPVPEVTASLSHKTASLSHKVPPGNAVHRYCAACVGGRQWNESEIESCTGFSCAFYKYRLGTRRVPVKAFRTFCLECMAGSAKLISECEVEHCVCYPYRHGSNPARSGMCGSGIQANMEKKAVVSRGKQVKVRRKGVKA